MLKKKSVNRSPFYLAHIVDTVQTFGDLSANLVNIKTYQICHMAHLILAASSNIG